METSVYLPVADPAEILKAVDTFELQEEEALLVLVGEQGEPQLSDIVGALSSSGVQFFGGLFPGLIHEASHKEAGAILIRFSAAVQPFIVTGLDQPGTVNLAINREGLEEGVLSTALVLVDGLTKNISGLLASLHTEIGEQSKFIGGGAGSLTLEQNPCVFSREGIFQDAAVVAVTSQSCRLGVRHGWRRHFGPLVVTRSEGNTIKELNWRPALEVYREALKFTPEDELNQENFFQVAMSYPFGILREGREDIVRDPLSLSDSGDLICVGEVPENAVVHVLTGDRSSLVEAAGQAGTDVHLDQPTGSEFAFVVDCVSRTLFLEEDFSTELKTMSEKIGGDQLSGGLMGALTLGEISSHGEGFIEFLNKTIVAAVFDA